MEAETYTRYEQALTLRREGRTSAQIAERMGCTAAKAQTLVRRAIKRVLREAAEDVRQLELSRLEVLIAALWTQALADVAQADPDYARFDRVKGLIEAKLRWGGMVPESGQTTDQRVVIQIVRHTAREPEVVVVPEPEKESAA